MSNTDKAQFELGVAAFYAGEPIDFHHSKAWRDGWQYAFTCAMRDYERNKQLGAYGYYGEQE